MLFGVRIGTYLSPSDNGAKMAPWVEGKGCQNSGDSPPPGGSFGPDIKNVPFSYHAV